MRNGDGTCKGKKGSMWGKRGYGQPTYSYSVLPALPTAPPYSPCVIPPLTDAPAQGPKPPTYAPTPCIADHPPYQYTTGCVTRFPCPQSIPPTGYHSRPPKLSGPAGSATIVSPRLPFPPFKSPPASQLGAGGLSPQPSSSVFARTAVRHRLPHYHHLSFPCPRWSHQLCCAPHTHTRRRMCLQHNYPCSCARHRSHYRHGHCYHH